MHPEYLILTPFAAMASAGLGFLIVDHGVKRSWPEGKLYGAAIGTILGTSLPMIALILFLVTGD